MNTPLPASHHVHRMICSSTLNTSNRKSKKAAHSTKIQNSASASSLPLSVNHAPLETGTEARGLVNPSGTDKNIRAGRFCWQR